MKRFKEWEKKFSRQEIKTCRQRYSVIALAYEEQFNIPIINDRWDLDVNQWDGKFVRDCVYDMSDSHIWQLIRTSMKGLTTQEKLGMLKAVFIEHVYNEKRLETKRIWRCRIDNYIGALCRGGQLQTKTYTILK